MGLWVATAGNELAWDATAGTYRPTALLADTSLPRTFKGPTDPATVAGYVASSNPYADTWINTDAAAGGLLLATGEEIIGRGDVGSNAIGCSSGTMRLTYFIGRRTTPVTGLVVPSGAVAAAGATLIRFGIFSVAGDGSLARVADTANDTTLLGAVTTFPASPKALSSTWNEVTGTLYAFGVLQVATTPAQLIGKSINAVMNSRLRNFPALSGGVAGLADLPTSVAAGSITALSSQFYAELQ